MPVVPPGSDSPVDESAQVTDLDTLISDIADHQRESDFLELINKLPSLSLYFSVVGPVPENLPHGERLVVQGEQIRCRTASIQGLECVLSFTTPTDPRLNPEHGLMMDGLEALRMVLKTNLDGLLIQSSRTGWVVIHRDQIEQILSPQPKPSLINEVGRLWKRMFKKPE